MYQFRGPLCFVNISVFQKRLKLAVHVENNSEDSEGDGCLKTLAMKVTMQCIMYGHIQVVYTVCENVVMLISLHLRMCMLHVHVDEKL